MIVVCLLTKMKFLSVLSLVLLWQNAQTEYITAKSPLLTSITYTMEPGKTGLKFTWDPVPNWDEQNPVIGYKVAVWEMKTGTKIIHRLVDGELKDEEVEDDTFPAKVPVGEPKTFTVSADVREVDYGYTKSEVWYEFAALAFTKTGEGPLSSISGVKSHAQKKSTEEI